MNRAFTATFIGVSLVLVACSQGEAPPPPPRPAPPPPPRSTPPPASQPAKDAATSAKPAPAADAKSGDFKSPVTQPSSTSGTRVDVTFADGHDTVDEDRGRPVILIAAALGVKPEVFREAFSHVKPAPAGTHPEPEQVRKNKEALMKALGPHGVTNDRLDEVSNYYRYNRGRGETWPTTSAKAVAIIENGKVARFEITEGGAGYSSPPRVAVPGFPHLRVKVTVSYGKDFKTNGGVTAIDVLP